MLPQSELISLYASMLRIRRVEEALADRYAEQEMRCPMHLCIGQEAIAAGVCYGLNKQDRIFSNHRAHGHYLAKGGSLNRMIAEIYGRNTGCCEGRGGSMHLIDRAIGFWGSTPIVGGTVPIAVGAAWAASLKAEDVITVVFFGDGCFEEGVMHESLNFSALHNLPIIFVCENNNYSVYTHLRNRQPERPIYKVAESHRLKVDHGDGNDIFQVYEKSLKAINYVRSKQGPYFIEFDTYRWLEHCGPNYDDVLAYRTPGELQQWQNRCPVESARKILLNEKLATSAQLERLEEVCTKEIISAFNYAQESNPLTLINLERSMNAA